MYLANNLFEKLSIHHFTQIMVSLKGIFHHFNQRTTPPYQLLSKVKRETYSYVARLCCAANFRFQASAVDILNDLLQKGKKGIKTMVVKRHRFFQQEKASRLGVSRQCVLSQELSYLLISNCFTKKTRFRNVSQRFLLLFIYLFLSDSNWEATESSGGFKRRSNDPKIKTQSCIRSYHPTGGHDEGAHEASRDIGRRGRRRRGWRLNVRNEFWELVNW